MMRTFQRISAMVFGFLLCGQASPGEEENRVDKGHPAREIQVDMIKERLMFAPSRINAKPGERLRFLIHNRNALSANFVICKGGRDTWKEVALGATAKELIQGRVPQSESVLVSSILLDTGQSTSVELQIPNVEDIYPFISSVPGHAPLMRGEIAVSNRVTELQDLKYFLYEGEWDELPDFSKLDPIAQGSLEGSRIDLSIVASRPDCGDPMWGIVVSANVDLPGMGSYEFALQSKHETRFEISGVAALSCTEGAEKPSFESRHDLDDSNAQLLLEMIGRGKIETPAAAWSGPSGIEQLTQIAIPESDWPGAFHLNPSESPIAVTVPMPNASSQSLAVGTPFGFHYCFDPDSATVPYAWIGGFLDAKPNPEISKPPGGNCIPLGKIIQLGNVGFPLRIGNFAKQPTITFLGYTQNEDTLEPELRYQFNEYLIRHSVTLAEDATGHSEFGVRHTYSIDPVPPPGTPLLYHTDPQVVRTTTDPSSRNGVIVFFLKPDEASFSMDLLPQRQ